MSGTDVTVVRIYLHEGQGQADNLLKRLHDWEHVRGVTVYRGVAGFGASGKIHTAKLVDLSLDLPVIVEFFDTPEKVAAILEHLSVDIKPGHMLSWTAQVND
jgi:PII-like signaling protein